MFITFCDRGSQGRCSIKKQAGTEHGKEGARVMGRQEIGKVIISTELLLNIALLAFVAVVL